MNNIDYAVKFMKLYGCNNQSVLANTIYHSIVSNTTNKCIEFGDNIFQVMSNKYWYNVLRYVDLENFKTNAYQIPNTTSGFFLSEIKMLCRVVSRSPFKDLIFYMPINREAPIIIIKFDNTKVSCRLYIAPTTDIYPTKTIDDGSYYLPVEQDKLDDNCNDYNRINGMTIPDNIRLIVSKPLIGSIFAVIQYYGKSRTNNFGINARCLNCGMTVSLKLFVSNDTDISNDNGGFNYYQLKSNHYNCSCGCPCYKCVKYRDWVHKEQIHDKLKHDRMKRLQIVRSHTGKDFGD